MYTEEKINLSNGKSRYSLNFGVNKNALMTLKKGDKFNLIFYDTEGNLRMLPNQEIEFIRVTHISKADFISVATNIKGDLTFFMDYTFSDSENVPEFMECSFFTEEEGKEPILNLLVKCKHTGTLERY